MQNEKLMKLLKEKPISIEKEKVYIETNITFDKHYKKYDYHQLFDQFAAKKLLIVENDKNYKKKE